MDCRCWLVGTSTFIGSFYDKISWTIMVSNYIWHKMYLYNNSKQVNILSTQIDGTLTGTFTPSQSGTGSNVTSHFPEIKKKKRDGREDRRREMLAEQRQQFYMMILILLYWKQWKDSSYSAKNHSETFSSDIPKMFLKK